MQTYDLSQLRTGERVISEHVPNVRSVSLGFWIGTGSRDETDARAGVSHFIEHLLFKGTGSHTAQEIAEIFDGLGGELNAATSRETTLVYARVPDDRLEQALDVIVGMVYDPSFADIDSERDVVIEEIAMVDDNPQDLVHDVVAEAVFGGHPLGRPVIGRADVISTVSRRSLARVPPRRLCPDNIVVSVAGNVTHERVLELLSARLPEDGDAARRTRKPFSRAPAPGYRFQRKSTEQYHVCLGAPGISRRDERRFAASLLDSILGGSASSRLFQEIREKRGMAYSVYSFASQYSDSGQVGLYVGTREENLVECIEIVARELGDVSAGNVRPGELERAKENLKGRMLLSMESTSNRMSRLGKSLITGTELLSLERDRRADRGGHRRRGRRGAGRPAPARPALGGRASGRARRGSVRRCSASTRRSSAARPPHEGHPPRQAGQGRLRARPGARAGGARARRDDAPSADAAVDFTRPDAVVGNVQRCLEAGVPGRRSARRASTRSRIADARARARAAGVLRAELRARGGADDALRRRGRQGAAGTPRSSSCTTRRSSTRPPGRRRRPRRCCRTGRRSTPCGCRASSRTRR